MDKPTNSSDNSGQSDVAKNAAKEFKIIIMIVLLILLIFLCLFVYNLIKCYLPKWRDRRQFVNENDNTTEGTNNRKLEMYDA